jgi:hypothetical protein
VDVARLVSDLRSRLVRIAAFGAITIGLVALALAVVVVAALGASPSIGLTVGLAFCSIVTAIGIRRARHAWTPVTTAGLIESRVPGLDNLLVTFVELARTPERASGRMREEVARQAADRAERVRPAEIAPTGQAVAALVLVALGTIGVVWSAVGVREGRLTGEVGWPAPIGIASVRARVTPPAYLGMAPRESENPERIEVPAGSTVRLEVDTAAPLAWIEDPVVGARPFAPFGEGRFALEWTPAGTTTLVIVAGTTTGVAAHSRLLGITVLPDGAPHVRIVTPGRDLAFTTPERMVDVVVEATDAEGLRDLEIRFIRMSGSGEAFDFSEGRVPLQVERTSVGEWRARARWSLGALGLEDGDSLVYRAVVRDSNPAADWVTSESFTIDVGKRLEFAGAGFAVPDEDRRYAISQQMVIVETERLQAERAKHSADQWTEQTRMLAVEQRMVRAEVVFLSGGEVQDEVAEAEHSDELQEGRFENAGRAEMLRAMNDMSRAEARLNAGDTSGALVFERSALQALQRAFDRRRYFLRTLPERSRIAMTRRLTGARRDARSSTRMAPPEAVDRLATERALMADLSAIAADGRAPAPSVVARLASVDAAADEWRALALALASAGAPEARQEAARTAMNAVAARARAMLAPVAGGSRDANGELTGWWAEESRARRPR